MLINPNTWTKIADGTCKVSSNSPFEYIVFADINKNIFMSGYCNPSLDVIHDGNIFAKTHTNAINISVVSENTSARIDTANVDNTSLKELTDGIKQLKQVDDNLVAVTKAQNFTDDQKQQARDNINAVSALDVTQLIQTNTVSLIEQVNRQSDPLNYFNPTIRFSIHQSTGTITHNSQKGITFTPDADSYTIFRLENVIDEITTYKITGQVKSSVASTLYVDINDLGDTPDPTRPDRQFYTAISTTTDYQPFSVIIKNTKVNNTYNFVDFTTQSIATFDIKELRIIKDYQQAINDAITTEQQARINADTTLDNRITALDTAYQQADTHLHEQIQALRQSDNITERLNNLHINTRNFLQKANFGNWVNGDWVDYKFVITNQTRAGAKFTRNFGLAGTQVIFSFSIKKTAGRIVSLGGHTQSLTNQQIYLDGNLVGDDFNNGFSYPNDEATHRVVIKATDAYDTVVGDKNLYIQPNRGTASGGFYNQQYSCEIWDCMLQVGTLTTDWTPAPEDIQSLINDLTARIRALETR